MGLRTHLRILLFVCLVGLGTAAPAAAVTYYVSPNSTSGACNNAGAGTNPAAPWCQIPGSSGTSHGNLQCGDVILLAGGNTQTQSVSVGSPRYPDCGASNPITVRIARAGDWPGCPTCESANNYTLDDLSFNNADRVHFLGRNANSRLLIGTSGNGGGIGLWEAARIWVRYFRSLNSGDYGISTGNVSDSLFQDGEINNSANMGVAVGSQGDIDGDRLAFINVEAHSSGPAGSCASRGGGFHVTGCHLCWFIDIFSHDNDCEGWSSGVIADPGMWRDQIVNIRRGRFVVNNGSSNSGERRCMIFSGDENNDGFEHILTVTHSQFYGCQSEGFSYGHGGAFGDFVNVGTFMNGGTEAGVDRAADYNQMVNSILVGRSASQPSTVSGYSSSGFNQNTPWRIFNTTLVGRTASSTVSNFDYTCSNQPTLGCQRNSDCGGGTCTYRAEFSTIGSPPDMFADQPTVTVTTAPPNWRVGASTACETSLTTSTFLNTCDFNFNGADPANIDRGRAIMRSTNSGTNSTGAIAVEINTPDASDAALNGMRLNDPRRYFYACSPTGNDTTRSFYCPAGSNVPADVIQIGGVQAAVTAVTASSITVASPVSWSPGTAIHWPYTGSAPDRGPFESGLAASPSPPTSLRIIR